MRQFEYHEEYDPTIEKLKNLGKKGWELVGINCTEYSVKSRYIFKKELYAKNV